MRPIRLIACGVTGICAISLLMPVTNAATAPKNAEPAASGNWSCRASLVRTEGFPIGLLNQEPVVANEQNDPCESESNSLLDPFNPIVIGDAAQVRALYTQTNNNGDSAEARSGVAEAIITIPGAPTIRAAALTSQASATCQGGAPKLSGSSNVLFVQVGEGAPLINVSEPQTITLPNGGGTVFLNQQTGDNNEITQRALRVETPFGTVTIAEAMADFHGNPCSGGNGGGGGDPPDCSDELDNDGDGFIDFPNDPGCASEQDDDETNDTPPQCSDGKDNDGDGRVDYPEDPGCDSREDDSETDGKPECSDNKDNDGDKRRDYPADNGCKSPTDDDEAAGFMTGGGGYDEADKKTGPEDFVNPGSSLRFGEVFPCDIGDKPGPNLNVTWHDPGMLGQFKLDELTRAHCRNDPLINPGRPPAEFDTYVGEGNGTWRDGTTGVRSAVTVKFQSIDRGEPGSPPVIGIDLFKITVRHAVLGVVAQGVGTLDHGNIQAHTPGSFREKKTAN